MKKIEIAFWSNTH